MQTPTEDKPEVTPEATPEEVQPEPSDIKMAGSTELTAIINDAIVVSRGLNKATTSARRRILATRRLIHLFSKVLTVSTFYFDKFETRLKEYEDEYEILQKERDDLVEKNTRLMETKEGLVADLECRVEVDG